MKPDPYPRTTAAPTTEFSSAAWPWHDAPHGPGCSTSSTGSNRGATPADRHTQKIVIAITVIVAILVSLAVAEVAGRFVTRAVDATGLTCGRDYEVMKASELKDFRLERWGSPQEVADAREDKFALTPADLRDAPPGLGRPTMVTPPRDDRYRPSLDALDDSTVLQFSSSTLVAADARTGEPLWGVRRGRWMGWDIFGDRLQLTDKNSRSITTLDPRTGDRLSCRKFDEAIGNVTGAGDDLWVQTETDDYLPREIVRYNAATGKLVAAARAPKSQFSDFKPVGDRIVFTPRVSTIFEGAGGSQDAPLIWFNPASGQSQRFSESYQQAVVRSVDLADGSVGTLLAEFESKRAWEKRSMRYRLLDAANETRWTVDARAPEEYDYAIDQSWQSGDVLILNDVVSVFGVSIATGKRLWSRDNRISKGRAALIGADKEFLVTGGRDRASDKRVTTVIDPVTGTSKDYPIPLLALRAYGDNYVVASDGWRNIVFWQCAQ